MNSRCGILLLMLIAFVSSGCFAATPLSIKPAGHEGFDVFTGGKLVAPIRLSSNGVITAAKVDVKGETIRLSGLQCKDPQAVSFAPNDFVSITNDDEPEVRFQITCRKFDADRWQKLFPDGAAPFHFLACSVPTAKVWHQRGWLNATPNADPFPLLEDVHVGSPEISCKWNRNWGYICPIGGSPIPMIGAWDPDSRLYVGYDFQEARATDQSARYVSAAYCWQQGSMKSFITLAYPYGGKRYGEQVYPTDGDKIASHFRLIIDTNLPDTEDPNERFQERLFAHYKNVLPRVPAMNDLSWIPGKLRLKDFAGPIGLDLFGKGGESTFYPEGTTLIRCWTGHKEMPIDTAARSGDTKAIEQARQSIETLLQKYAKRVTIHGDDCLFWEKPLTGEWRPNWGGAPVTTMHNTDAWYPARVLVELYRYDRSLGKADPDYLKAIDGIFNWTKHFVWTRNEFADVPSSPFAIGGTLSTAFLLDYYFTFKDDPQRAANAQLALNLADHVAWRYLPIWAMDSDRYDGALDSSFLIEPNSGRDWAGLACANEVHWDIDSLTQVYVHTGDSRMRYYLRGILQRWHELYRPVFEDSLADCGHDAMTEGLGFFDGCGPGRGERYNYGSASSLPINEPVGDSKMRVVAGARAAIAFCKDGADSDIADYRTDGNGSCSFRVVSKLRGDFDVSFSYPDVDVSQLPVKLTRDGKTQTLSEKEVRRPEQSPSSLYLYRLRNGDVVEVGSVPADAKPFVPDDSLTYSNSSSLPAPSGGFDPLPVQGDKPLIEDWNDLNSFAGLAPGEVWAYGVPYEQRTSAATRPVDVSAVGAKTLFVAYAPPSDAPLSASPVLLLDNGRTLPLAGKPAPAWRAWPPMFTRMILLDSAAVPAGRTVRQIDPHGTLLMAATSFRGSAADLQQVLTRIATANTAFAAENQRHQILVALRKQFAAIPAGTIAVLPGSGSGAPATFLTVTGLKKKCVFLSPQQLVDPGQFNAKRFPVTLYLSGEEYVKTVRREGDGKEAISRYLSEGGTLVLLSSQPFPFCYGGGPGGKGKSDPLLPELGIPISNAFEKPSEALEMHVDKTQNIIKSLPATFPFPDGDQRLRSVDRTRLNPADKYVPIIAVQDAAGKSYGDAACYFEFGTGPAKGGKVLYVWSTLLQSDQGGAILHDSSLWLLNVLAK